MNRTKENASRIFPNPSRGNFEIAGGSGLFQTLQITDASGKVMYRDTLHTELNKNTIRINLEGKLPPGIYTISLTGISEARNCTIIIEK